MKKAVLGYYWSGEFMALYMLFDDSRLATTLRWVTGTDVISMQSLTFAPIPFDLSPRDRFFCMAVSWIVVVGEIGFPLLALVSKTRTMAVSVMMGMMLFIWFFSGIASFAFTSLACFLLFFPHRAKRNFLVLGLALGLYLADLGVGLL